MSHQRGWSGAQWSVNECSHRHGEGRALDFLNYNSVTVMLLKHTEMPVGLQGDHTQPTQVAALPKCGTDHFLGNKARISR